VAACAGCHGPTGAGIPAQYPRISGQFAEYVDAQLKAFRSGARANDPNGMMRGVAARMSEREIKAVDETLSKTGGSRSEASKKKEAADADIQQLDAALAKLPPRQRVAVTMFDAEGYSHGEIAEVLGVPEGTVRSDVFHARRALREALAMYRGGE